jgi:hypothetical protein
MYFIIIIIIYQVLKEMSTLPEQQIDTLNTRKSKMRLPLANYAPHVYSSNYVQITYILSFLPCVGVT